MIVSTAVHPFSPSPERCKSTLYRGGGAADQVSRSVFFVDPCGGLNALSDWPGGPHKGWTDSEDGGMSTAHIPEFVDAVTSCHLPCPPPPAGRLEAKYTCIYYFEAASKCIHSWLRAGEVEMRGVFVWWPGHRDAGTSAARTCLSVAWRFLRCGFSLFCGRLCSPPHSYLNKVVTRVCVCLGLCLGCQLPPSPLNTRPAALSRSLARCLLWRCLLALDTHTLASNNDNDNPNDD